MPKGSGRRAARAATVGTPVSGPLATDGSMTKVRVLDVFWRWTTPTKCAAVQAPVWIDRGAVGSDYPTARDAD